MSSESPVAVSHHGGVVEYATSRPRVLGWIRSAAILDGDWGTSVAYVMGLGFALAGYASFWHLLLMLALTCVVAFNYITICRLYPNGGGVYSSVAHRSRLLAVVGALLLSADYIVTMALSILDACHYFNLPHPDLFAIGIIVVIGFVNWYGPKHSGGLALAISGLTVLVLIVMVAFSVPDGLSKPSLAPLSGGFFHNWGIFVGFILSLSGIEAISNMTGLMRDPTRDSRRAILSVLAKVVIVNVFLSLAMHAIPGLSPGDHKEDMLRFLGEHYVGPWFGWMVAFALGTLLISAGNTALNGLISIQFLMAVDKELPTGLRKLNKHGVPIVPLLVSCAIPITVLTIISDVETLSHLYAIGLVGAIVINLGSTATDSKYQLKPRTKIFMLVSAFVLFCVEVSIAIAKPEASIFAAAVLMIGLGSRMLAKRRMVVVQVPAMEEALVPAAPGTKKRRRALPSAKYLVAIKDRNDKLLKFAVEEAKARNALLFVLRVKEIAVGALPERMEMAWNGEERRIEEICSQAGIDAQLIQIPSYEVGYTIVEQAATFGVERIIIGATMRTKLENVFKGSVLRSVNQFLPEEIQLVIFGG